MVQRCVNHEGFHPYILLGQFNSLRIQLFLYLIHTQLWSIRLFVIALIPSITQEPSDEVEAVLTMILLEITLHKLCLHGVLEFLVPAALYFNDNRDSIVCFPISAFDDRVYMYVRTLASTNFTLSIDNNASVLDIFRKVVFDIIRKIVFAFRGVTFGTAFTALIP